MFQSVIQGNALSSFSENKEIAMLTLSRQIPDRRCHTALQGMRVLSDKKGYSPLWVSHLDERLLNIGEAGQIGLAELDLEVVGNNGLPLHTDRTGIGHLAHETVPNFHRSHAAAEETSDGAVDQPFESSLD